MSSNFYTESIFGKWKDLHQDFYFQLGRQKLLSKLREYANLKQQMLLGDLDS